MTAIDDPRPLTRAEETYLRFLLANEHDVPAEVDEPARADPDLLPELHELHSRWLAESRRAPVTDGSTLSELRSILGDEVDPAVRLDDTTTAEATDLDTRPERRPAVETGGYAVLGRLAEGRLGTLLAVRDRNLDRPLALKAHREGTSLREFLREAAVISSLAHPGVLPVHELGVDRDGLAYFTMRRLRGSHLVTVLRSAWEGRDGWTIDRALGVLVRLCDTLAAAHEQGVVHGDLNPSNVLVGDFGEVVVTGWSRARCRDEPEVEALELATRGELSLADELEGAEEPLAEAPRPPGTRNDALCLAPEVSDGDAAVGPAADVYSIGALLHHLITGGPPSDSTESNRSRKAPPELLAICRRALDPFPERRYRGPKELAEELHAYREQRVVRAYRTGAVAELVQWIRRNRALATSAIAVLTIVLGGLAWILLE